MMRMRTLRSGSACREVMSKRPSKNFMILIQIIFYSTREGVEVDAFEGGVEEVDGDPYAGEAMDEIVAL